MGRKLRVDAEDNVYHLVNRGTARRTILEHRRDWRYFESRLAYACRRRDFDVLAFCLMGNHFHLLIRSLGAMSEAMRRIQGEHSRYFNRSRVRTGPLFTGRFRSFLVANRPYLENAYRYIDENALAIKDVTRPEQWRWGSAHLFALPKPPLWLSRDVVNLLEITYDPDSSPVADLGTRQVRAALVEARMSRPCVGEDPMEEVLSGASDRVWKWMLSAAELADGTKPGIPVAGPSTVRQAVAALSPEIAELRIELPNVNRQSFRRVLLAGLLRDAAAATFVEIAQAVQRSPATARRLHALHGRALREDARYGEIALALIETCVAPLRTRRYPPTSDR